MGLAGGEARATSRLQAWSPQEEKTVHKREDVGSTCKGFPGGQSTWHVSLEGGSGARGTSVFVFNRAHWWGESQVMMLSQFRSPPGASEGHLIAPCLRCYQVANLIDINWRVFIAQFSSSWLTTTLSFLDRHSLSLCISSQQTESATPLRGSVRNESADVPCSKTVKNFKVMTAKP